MAVVPPMCPDWCLGGTGQLSQFRCHPDQVAHGGLDLLYVLHMLRSHSQSATSGGKFFCVLDET